MRVSGTHFDRLRLLSQLPGARGLSSSKAARALMLFVVLGLSACGGSSIEVERMAALPADTQSGPFLILRAKGQETAKEYNTYAEQVAQVLTSKGFARVDAASKAHYALMIFYDGDGIPEGTDDWRHNFRDRKASDTRSLLAGVALYDLTRPNRPDEKVFGGQAVMPVESRGHEEVIIRALFSAIMKDFPGKPLESYSESAPSIK